MNREPADGRDVWQKWRPPLVLAARAKLGSRRHRSCYAIDMPSHSRNANMAAMKSTIAVSFSLMEG
jgi:hypothetical protein